MWSFHDYLNASVHSKRYSGNDMKVFKINPMSATKVSFTLKYIDTPVFKIVSIWKYILNKCIVIFGFLVKKCVFLMKKWSYCICKWYIHFRVCNGITLHNIYWNKLSSKNINPEAIKISIDLKRLNLDSLSNPRVKRFVLLVSNINDNYSH